MTERPNVETLTSLLEKLMAQAQTLPNATAWNMPNVLHEAESSITAAVHRMRRMADTLLSGTLAAPLQNAGLTARQTEDFTENDRMIGRSITQNIYLTENDPSPYQTAKAIRRESEAMLRL